MVRFFWVGQENVRLPRDFSESDQMSLIPTGIEPQFLGPRQDFLEFGLILVEGATIFEVRSDFLCFRRYFRVT